MFHGRRRAEGHLIQQMVRFEGLPGGRAQGRDDRIVPLHGLRHPFNVGQVALHDRQARVPAGDLPGRPHIGCHPMALRQRKIQELRARLSIGPQDKKAHNRLLSFTLCFFLKLQVRFPSGTPTPRNAISTLSRRALSERIWDEACLRNSLTSRVFSTFSTMPIAMAGALMAVMRKHAIWRSGLFSTIPSFLHWPSSRRMTSPWRLELSLKKSRTSLFCARTSWSMLRMSLRLSRLNWPTLKRALRSFSSAVLSWSTPRLKS